MTSSEIFQASLRHDVQKRVKKETRLREKIEEKNRCTWEVDKAQLYMDMYDMRQRRTASTLSTNSQAEQENKLVEPSEPVQGQIAAEGDFLRRSANDKKEMLAKAKTAIREHLMNQILDYPGQSSNQWVPQEWLDVWSEDFEPGQPSYQWLPQFEGSHLQGSGAPKGTPFLGTVANIEHSMRQGWNVADMPGDTSDQKWFHFVYPHMPLRGFENHPFFVDESTSSKEGETLKAP